MLPPIFTIKDQFFDRPEVQKMIDRKTQRVLIKTAAFTRRTAQFSMKSREGTAPAGEPPYAHEKSLKRLIFFAYERSEKKAIVGPTLLPSYEGRDIPLLMEEGGVRTKQLKDGTVKRMLYEPHPYMVPALEENVPKVLAMFKDS